MIIIEAVLLSPARIASRTSGPWHHDVAILPGIGLGLIDGVQAINPLSGGVVEWELDYAITQYKDEKTNGVGSLLIFLND